MGNKLQENFPYRNFLQDKRPFKPALFRYFSLQILARKPGALLTYKYLYFWNNSFFCDSLVSVSLGSVRSFASAMVANSERSRSLRTSCEEHSSAIWSSKVFFSSKFLFNIVVRRMIWINYFPHMAGVDPLEKPMIVVGMPSLRGRLECILWHRFYATFLSQHPTCPS